MENPFMVPEDDEMIDFQEIKKKEKEARKARREQKVWVKGVNQHRIGALRRFDEITEPQQPEKTVGIADAAQAAQAVDRVRARESVQKTIEKKREMFLLQMQIDIKKEEIKKVEQFSLLREYGLKNSEDMLIEDMERFNQYWDDCKRKSHDAMKEVKRLNKQKQEINQESKKLGEEIQQVNSQIQKYEETLEEYTKYKDFIHDAISSETSVSEFLNNPCKVLEAFEDYAENNLVHIQNIQDIEQDLEQIKQEFARNDTLLDQRLAEMKSKKEFLIKTIEEKNKGIAGLESKLNKNQTGQVSGTLKQKLEESIKRMQDGEIDSHFEPLILLEDVENTLDKYLRIFNELETAKETTRMNELFNKQESLRRDKARLKSDIEEQRSNEERSNKYKERTMHPIERKLGRLPMTKSKIPEKKKKKVVKQIPQEILDRREFLDESI